MTYNDKVVRLSREWIDYCLHRLWLPWFIDKMKDLDNLICNIETWIALPMGSGNKQDQRQLQITSKNFVHRQSEKDDNCIVLNVANVIFYLNDMKVNKIMLDLSRDNTFMKDCSIDLAQAKPSDQSVFKNENVFKT